MELGYFAADAVGITLYQITNTLVGNETREIKVGPWKVELPVDVRSDLLFGTELSFWVTLGKKVRLYLVVKQHVCWLMVLGATELTACEEQTLFASQTIKERIKEIKPAIKGVFRWGGFEWEKVEYDGATGG